MDSGNCRSINANRELHTAQKIYETRTTARRKRKIAELEASVKEETVQWYEEEIAGEVDWLPDPGTPSKRATQFVRTQAESWKLKTLLARALDSKDSCSPSSSKGKSTTDVNLEQLRELYKILDFKISAAHEVAETVNKNLTLLIRLLRQTINSNPPHHASKQQAQPRDTHSLQSIQERVDKHVLEVGLDTISHIGMPPQ